MEIWRSDPQCIRACDVTSRAKEIDRLLRCGICCPAYGRLGSWLCENALAGALTPCNWEASSKCKRFFSGARLCPDCRHERLNAEDVHNAREIIGQYVQGHLGGDPRQRLHQEVRCTHPHLERGEGVFSCLATHAHRLRVLIETLLHGFEYVFVFP